MRRADSALPWGEFELIDKLFAPLARGLAGAFGLKDDVAVLVARAHHDLVLKIDSVIENVHFLAVDPPDTVAQKALRRTLSDLAAKGAAPEAYLLAIALPLTTEQNWLENFVQGLARDQEQFGIALAGGETNRTPGALTITVTAIGWVPEGRLVRRNGAEPGDEVWVTGAVGDAGGGLCILKDATVPRSAARDHLVRRFRVPEPRLAFGVALRGVASAAIDVSDGLLADLGHVADVSRVRIEINSDSVPISSELRALWGDRPETVGRAVSAGDDYEIAFTASAAAADEVNAVAQRTGTAATRIGRVVQGSAGVALLDSSGHVIFVERKGFTHF